MCLCACMRACVCVCVRERERERERERDREREGLQFGAQSFFRLTKRQTCAGQRTKLTTGICTMMYMHMKTWNTALLLQVLQPSLTQLPPERSLFLSLFKTWHNTIGKSEPISLSISVSKTKPSAAKIEPSFAFHERLSEPQCH